MICDVLDLKLKIKTKTSGKKLSTEIQNEISVNGVLYTGEFNEFCLFSDTHLNDKSEYQKKFEIVYNEDYIQYNRSIKRFDGILSNVYLDTCSCGHAGCAGFWNGVRVYKKKKYFKYVAKKSDGYDKGILSSGKLNLTFSKENILNIRKYIVDFYISNASNLGTEHANLVERCRELKSNPNLFK